ncbi:MAG: helix-hairpin-helix domain-containing protein [Archangium sp.]
MKNGMKTMAVAVMLAVGAGGSAMAKPAQKKEVTGVVNLNTATAQQLDLLPGIGQKAAKRIIEHRAKEKFASVDDLRKVKGFGAKKLEKLKPFLTVTGPTTVAMKKASAKSETAEAAKPAPQQLPPAQGRRAGGKR